MLLSKDAISDVLTRRTSSTGTSLGPPHPVVSGGSDIRGSDILVAGEPPRQPAPVDNLWLTGG
jgi:hypothetical protein